jgi:hypothetical protein
MMSILGRPLLVLGAGLLAAVGTVGAMAGSGVMFAGASDGPAAAQPTPSANGSIGHGTARDVIEHMLGPNDDMGAMVATDDGSGDQDQDQDRDRDQVQDQDHCCDQDGAEHMARTDGPAPAQHQVGMQEEHHGDGDHHNGPNGDDDGDNGDRHDDCQGCESGDSQSGDEGSGQHGMGVGMGRGATQS